MQIDFHHFERMQLLNLVSVVDLQHHEGWKCRTWKWRTKKDGRYENEGPQKQYHKMENKC